MIRVEAETGEGPVWDHRTGELVWVDIPAGVLHRSDVASRSDVALTVGMMVGAVAPTTAAQGWAAAAEDGFGIIDASGHLDLLDRVIPQPHLRMNDGACDGRGRMWAGSLTRSFEPGGGRLHCWEHGRPSWVALEGLTLPKGIGWRPWNFLWRSQAPARSDLTRRCMSPRPGRASRSARISHWPAACSPSTHAFAARLPAPSVLDVHRARRGP
ncbi:MAG: SMP-30/gluconolactonase/LRE family protein [Micromonosporaceae bacterium]